MVSPVDIFNLWCAEQKPPIKRYWPISPQLGGLFYNCRVQAENHVEHHRNSLLKDIRIYFDYIDDGELNARASIWPDPKNKLGIIAIYRGAVLLPLDLFQRMFAHPEVLPELGNSKIETTGGQLNEGLAENIDTLHAARLQAGLQSEPVAPRCPIRRQFAIEVAGFAFDFLFQHELAHILSGHVDFVSPYIGTASILESTLSATDELGLPTITRQAIELSADSTAVGLTIDHLIQMRAIAKGPPGWERYFSTLEQRAFAWAFAIAGVFRLWGIKINPDDMEDEAYPPMAMRFASAFTTASTHIGIVKPEFAEKFDQLVDNALLACGRAVRMIGGPPVKSEDIRPVYGAAGKSHYTKIRECWKNVVLPELEKLSYWPLHQQVSA